MSSAVPHSPHPEVRTDPFGIGGAHAGVVLASVGIASADGDESPWVWAPHPDELALAANMTDARRAAFLAGRRALRAAVHALSPESALAPLLHTGRGAPHLPVGLTGSISHKRHRAIAVAAQQSDVDRPQHVGVDLEERPSREQLARPSIATRILTPREQDALTSLDDLAHREATLLRFALKEAVYKAIDPTVHRYVRFTEVELDVHTDGRADVTLLLPEFSAHPVHVDAHWMFDDDYIVAMASCRATPPAK